MKIFILIIGLILLLSSFALADNQTKIVYNPLSIDKQKLEVLKNPIVFIPLILFIIFIILKIFKPQELRIRI